MIQKHSKLIKQIFFFGVVGGISFLIDLSVTTALYTYAHFPAYLAGILGFLSSFFFNFPINRKHVFQHTKYDRFSLKIQMILFASLCVFNLLATGLFIEVLVNYIHIPISISKILITGVIAVWNFVLFKTFIFSKKHESIDKI
jgi:putative flippase GtrA